MTFQVLDSPPGVKKVRSPEVSDHPVQFELRLRTIAGRADGVAHTTSNAIVPAGIEAVTTMFGEP